MDDTSSLIDMRHLKIKSIDGQTYELTVPKDVRSTFKTIFDFILNYLVAFFDAHFCEYSRS